MNKNLTRAIALAAILFVALALAGVAGLDSLAARWSVAPAGETSAWDRGTDLLDLLALKPISNFLLGFLLLVAAGAMLAVRRTRRWGWPLLYVGAVQFAATVIADLAKPIFGRLRPFEAAATGGSDTWLVGANSFPSGHAAFYAGLFLPLMLLYPRFAALLVIPPGFIAFARVQGGDHYPSDVFSSLALAAALAVALLFIARRGWESADRPAS